jgi:hypothetical protein
VNGVAEKQQAENQIEYERAGHSCSSWYVASAVGHGHRQSPTSGCELAASQRLK